MAARTGKLPVGTFEQIAEAQDLGAGKLVSVPEWGVSVKIRGLTRGEARLSYELATADDREASIIACGIVEPKLSPEQAREIVTGKGFKPTESVIEAILELSGLSDPDVRPAAETLIAAASESEDGYLIPKAVFGQLEAALGSTFRS
jgi:hypothetical protein